MNYARPPRFKHTHAPRCVLLLGDVADLGEQQFQEVSSPRVSHHVELIHHHHTCGGPQNISSSRPLSLAPCPFNTHTHTHTHTNTLPSRCRLSSSMSLLTRELAFSMVHTATSSDVKPPAAEVLPMYPSTRTPASSNTLYTDRETHTRRLHKNAPIHTQATTQHTGGYRHDSTLT